MNAKEIALRAVKTFFQAGISYLVVNFSAAALDFTDLTANRTVVISLFVAAGAAGISAAWNGVLSPLFVKSLEEDVEKEDNDDDCNDE